MKTDSAARARGRREKAELARQGAKSAARGERPSSNPMEETRNSPASTGETHQQWSGRRDAWQSGFDQQSNATTDGRPPSSKGRDDELD
jgi:hypothetical protein